MKIEWLGHASFVLTYESGFKVITDPYESGSYNGAVGYGKINMSADVVTISHTHPDHNCPKEVKGDYILITECKSVKLSNDIEVMGFHSYHDTNSGKDRGENIIFKFTGEGLNVVHFGDLGHTLSVSQVEALGLVDIAIIPVGGHFTIDHNTAWEVIKKVKPKIIIPMHYKTEKLDFPIAGVAEFLSGTDSVRHADELDITSKSLPDNQEVWVLKHLR
ncbi:MAG: MBL fold metallo-hydrolase [bacterium]|nr:MBL fold metallo-hydrolase [bacterium]